ncbi:MAG TPA: helix-hairpin-helix domain-containing protein, partial [bacterium]|nr:helix-hairpin-helix domain-containing protein [bacterium]
MKGAALGLVAAILATPALAPADPPPASDSYETLLGDVETESGYNNVLYLLDEAAKHPVNLLAADGAELAKLPGVSPGLAREIVNLRTAGGLKSLEDISTLPGANDRLVEALRPFVVIQPVEKRPLPVKTMLRLRVMGSPPTSRIIGNKTNVACEIAAG